jgi:uncharacterized protein (DUF4415 family)
VIVWLWDAAGPAGDACGVTDDQAAARQRAQALLTAGHATTAKLQQAVLKYGLDVLDAHYDRSGAGWQARRTQAGTFRWHPLPAPSPG